MLLSFLPVVLWLDDHDAFPCLRARSGPGSADLGYMDSYEWDGEGYAALGSACFTPSWSRAPRGRDTQYHLKVITHSHAEDLGDSHPPHVAG